MRAATAARPSPISRRASSRRPSARTAVLERSRPFQAGSRPARAAAGRPRVAPPDPAPARCAGFAAGFRARLTSWFSCWFSLVQRHAVTDDAGIWRDADLEAEITSRLAGFTGSAKGQSNRICRALILSEPPSMAEGEITAKGNLNFRKILARRADILDRLYSEDPAVIRL